MENVPQPLFGFEPPQPTREELAWMREQRAIDVAPMGRLLDKLDDHINIVLDYINEALEYRTDEFVQAALYGLRDTLEDCNVDAVREEIDAYVNEEG